jgi:hypothetical protein
MRRTREKELIHNTYIFYNMGAVWDSASYTYSYNTHTINTNVGYDLEYAITISKRICY